MASTPVNNQFRSSRDPSRSYTLSESQQNEILADSKNGNYADFKNYDKNKDGKVTRLEYVQSIDIPESDYDEKKYDVNGDGKSTHYEYLEVANAPKQVPKNPKTPIKEPKKS
jgi:EF hand